MNEQPKSSISRKHPEPFVMPQGIEWLWWGLLVVSLLVGFGMTMFAPV
jgi:hypothetical protein